MVLVAPTSQTINQIHDAFMERYGCKGFMCEGMIEGCMERAMTYIYKFQPFPKLFLKAAAILYSFITFHPFIDGNKRTAFETTRVFLRLNGHSLTVTPKEGVEFTRAIADSRITDIGEIAVWLQKHSKWNVVYAIQSTILRLALEGYHRTPKEQRYRYPKETLLTAKAFTLYPE